ncbi:hypothetical protein JCM9534A_09570 [Catenuloplanes indicus JCM 9534]
MGTGAIVFMVLGGLVFIGIGVAMFAQGLPHKGGLRAPGRIVEVQVIHDEGTRWRTIYEFQDAAGATHRFTDPEEETFEPTVGERVEVSYLPGDPGSARKVDEVLSEDVLLSWLGGTAMIAIGVLIPLAGRRDRRTAG